MTARPARYRVAPGRSRARHHAASRKLTFYAADAAPWPAATQVTSVDAVEFEEAGAARLAFPIDGLTIPVIGRST